MKSFVVLFLAFVCVGCVAEALPDGPRHVNGPLQQDVVNAWHEAGHPHCYDEPSYMVLTDDEAKEVCNGVFACHRDGEIYLWFGHYHRDSAIQFYTIHWLLHCTGQPADPHHTRTDLWEDLRAKIGMSP